MCISHHLGTNGTLYCFVLTTRKCTHTIYRSFDWGSFDMMFRILCKSMFSMITTQRMCLNWCSFPHNQCSFPRDHARFIRIHELLIVTVTTSSSSLYHPPRTFLFRTRTLGGSLSVIFIHPISCVFDNLWSFQEYPVANT